MEKKDVLEKINYFLENRIKREILERIESFYKDRINRIINNETFFSDKLAKGAKLVLHLIPFDSFDSPKSFDLSQFYRKYQELKPIKFNGIDQMYNLEGLVHFSRINLGEKAAIYGYVQLFRDGKIEAVDCYELSSSGTKLFYPISIENIVVSKLKEYLSFLKNLGVKTPIVFYLTLIGVKDYIIKYKHNTHFDNIYPIKFDNLNLQKVIIEAYDVTLKKLLKEVFDQMWNACGYPRSYHSNENGE